MMMPRLRRPSAAGPLLLGVAALAWVGCGAPADTGVSLSRDIMPIVAGAGCATAPSCHADRTHPQTHFTDLRTADSTYGSWVNAPCFDHCVPGSTIGVSFPSTDKKRVVPGDPDASMLLVKLQDPRDECEPFYGRMPPPPRPRLTAEQIDTIRTWILQGARNN